MNDNQEIAELESVWDALVDQPSAAANTGGRSESAAVTLLEDLNDLRLLLLSDATLPAAHDDTAGPWARHSQLEIGERIAGYTVLHQIGQGGMGIVFAARQEALDREVALKVIRSGPLATAEDIARFHAEATTAGSLQHPGIVAVYDSGQWQGQHFLAMELVEGTTLADELIAGPLEPKEAINYAIQICDAVSYAHEAGVLHRDLKPSNVLVSLDDRLRVTDFGLAKLLNRDAEDTLTASGAMVGTPSYMSPEQAIGDNKRVSASSDLYAIGAILYAMLTGRPPFRAATPLQTIRQVVDADVASPRALNPDVSRDLDTVCLKALAKAPHDRYASAIALREELARVRDGRTISARPIGPIGRLVRWGRRNPAWAACLLAACMAATAGITWHNVKLQREVNRTRAARDQAIRDYERSTRAVNRMLTVFADEDLANVPRVERVRREMLTEALELEQQFLADHGDDPTRRAAVADAEVRLARIHTQLGDLNAAESILRSQLERHPTIDTRLELAKTLVRQKRFEEAEPLYRSILEECEPRLNDADDASAVHWLRQVADSQTDLAQIATSKGDSNQAAALAEQAVANYRELQTLMPNDEDLEFIAVALNTQGNATLHTDIEAGTSLLQESLRLRRQLLELFPDTSYYRDHLAEALNNLALALRPAEEFEEIVDLLEESIRLRTALVAEFPDSPQYASGLGSTMLNLGYKHWNVEDFENAEKQIRQGLALLNEVHSKNPSLGLGRTLFMSTLSHAEVLRKLGDPHQALAAMQAMQTARQQQAQSPNTQTSEDTRNDISDMALLNSYIGDVHCELGQFESGLDMMQKGLNRMRTLLVERFDTVNRYRYEDRASAYVRWLGRRQDKSATDVIVRQTAGISPSQEHWTYFAASLWGYYYNELLAVAPSDAASLDEVAKTAYALLARAAALGYEPQTPPEEDAGLTELAKRSDFPE